MMTYLPVPLHRVQLGKPLPIDLWSPAGRLLLRRGQQLQSEQHREMLATHQASMTESDAQAWQRSLVRQLRGLYPGAGTGPAPLVALAQLMHTDKWPLPSEIADADYQTGHALSGNWLDLQDLLRDLLYQANSALNPLPRLSALENRAQALLLRDPEDALFVLFQALPDLALGYCANHALLCGVVSSLSARKLGLDADTQALLLRAAMLMNMGMARLQDSLSRQLEPPTPAQRQVIDAHPQHSVALLTTMGVQDPALMALVQQHHLALTLPQTHPLHTPARLLHLTDTLVAKMAPRKARSALLPLAATQTLVMQSTENSANLRRAMAAVLGFYPPGTYVQLVNGETAVVIARGLRATSPHTACLVNPRGMPVSTYSYRDTSLPGLAVKAPLNTSAVHVQVNSEKIRRLRQQHGV